jgi:hypothetical protein
LKGLAISFGSNFLSRTWAWAIILLTIAVELVSFGGAPDLVELGHVACVRFYRFLLKTVSCWFFLSGFPYKLDTWHGCRVCINFQLVSLINWLFSFLMNRQRFCWLLPKKLWYKHNINTIDIIYFPAVNNNLQ